MVEEQILWTEKQQMISYMLDFRLFYIVSHDVLITDLQKHNLHESTFYRMGTKLDGEQYSEWYQRITVKMKELILQSSIKLTTGSGSTQYSSYHLDNETEDNSSQLAKGMKLKRLQRMLENQTWTQNMVEKLPKKYKFSPSYTAVNTQHMQVEWGINE